MDRSALFLFCFIVLVTSCKNTPGTPKETNPILVKPPIAALTEAIAAAPKAAAYFNRGTALHKIDQDSLALNDFKKAISLDSSKATYFSAVANILFEHKDLSGSIPFLQKALARDAKDVGAHLKLAKAMLYIKKYKEAFTEINTVLRQDTYNPEGYYLKGMIYKDSKDTDRALSSFQTAVNVSPDYKDAILQIGQIYLAKGNASGLQYLNNAFRLDSTDVFPLYARGMWYQQKGDDAAAKNEYRRAFRHNPGYADAYFNTGFILLQQDSVGLARKQFELFVDASPNEPRGYYYRGLCAEAQKDKAAAEQNYKQALSLDKDYAQAKEAMQRIKN